VGAVTGSVGGALAAIAGRPRVEEGAEVHAGFAIDGLLPRWVVRPATLEQVSGVLALAWDAGLAVVPHGSGAAQELGVPPAKVDVVLDLRDLDRVVEYNPDDLTITVQAGVTLGTLESWLAARRQFLPLDPPGARARTLGGIAATGASGPLRLRYGTLRDLLLGVRFVQADGVVTWGGARVVKSVSGYDVPKLMVGACGTLGVIGELTLRLHPLPDAEQTWVVPCRDAGAAQDFVLRLLDSTVQPSRVEFLNAAALAACEIAGSAAAVAVSIGTAEAAVRAQGDALGALARAAGSAAGLVAAGFWDRYDAAMAPEEGVRLGVGTLASKVGETAGEIERAVAASLAGAAPTLGGCAPLGSLRASFPGADPARVKAIVERLRAAVAAAGGSVTVQRAPRDVRRAVDPWGPVEPGPLALMRALKAEFDARRVLNPGRFVGGL
jgi:glycolate oxidase FAD binding subunit